MRGYGTTAHGAKRTYGDRNLNHPSFARGGRSTFARLDRMTCPRKTQARSNATGTGRAYSRSVALRSGMAEHNIDVPQDKRIELRIGIHVGDIIIEENDIFGDGVKYCGASRRDR